jgi:RNA polymerase sigma factor (sigma-70 family)
MRLKTDEELARDLSTGEVEAFDELYRRYSGRLATYTGRLLRDRGAGEDVAQSSLMSAYETIRRGSRPRHVRAWLFRIARNTALEQLAGRRPVGNLATERVVEGGHSESSARAALLAAIEALPERQRRVFLLREIQGLRIDEIAGELALTVTQVEQSLFAARNRLAEHLVFGERLACATLGNVDIVQLGSVGRRAVKAHLRSCAACRSARPAAAARASLGLVPVQVLAFLRGVPAAFFGGGSSIAAPAAALTAAGALAVATPVGVPKLAHKLLNRPAAAPAAAPAVETRAPSPPHRRRSAAPTPLVRRAPADRPAVRTQRQALPPAAPPGGSVLAPPSAPTPEPPPPLPPEPAPALEPQAPKPPAADPSAAEPSLPDPPPAESPAPRAPDPPAADPPAHGQPPVETVPPRHDPPEDATVPHDQPTGGHETAESDPVEPVPAIEQPQHGTPPIEEPPAPVEIPPSHGTTP